MLSCLCFYVSLWLLCDLLSEIINAPNRYYIIILYTLKSENTFSCKDSALDSLCNLALLLRTYLSDSSDYYSNTAVFLLILGRNSLFLALTSVIHLSLKLIFLSSATWPRMNRLFPGTFIRKLLAYFDPVFPSSFK